ncbi:hypothetical protein F5984_10770 [Rudanella paleaurantiibacter]|uniref:DUF1735 domain-containing protein n=1 Tax=Rudanella paleaurantiibacter TaxID=2614655 RepID=A0A7J5U2Q8_9BACT|nr:hypothetical protein [Rudanella paleaurantiibacter]KAB7731274.1 hypothetical protein F5984_10770 [Rudanella paleaurantiibacter]
MKLTLIKGVLLAAMALSTVACKDDLEYGTLVRDNRPAVPVTFTNATTYGGNPFIEISRAGATPITFTLSIPAGSGRTIKEITRVVGGGTGINAGSLNTSSLVINTAPIAGTGTTATFTMTQAAFAAKYPAVVLTPTGNPAAPREIAFIFLVTLDDNTQIVTQQVRARVLA